MRWHLGLQGLECSPSFRSASASSPSSSAWRQATRWLQPIAAAGYFVVGLLISEVWFGWATEEDLQPNIDGLSFDEVLLGLLPGSRWSSSSDTEAEGGGPNRRGRALSVVASARVAPSPTGKGWSTSTGALSPCSPGLLTSVERSCRRAYGWRRQR